MIKNINQKMKKKIDFLKYQYLVKKPILPTDEKLDLTKKSTLLKDQKIDIIIR